MKNQIKRLFQTHAGTRRLASHGQAPELAGLTGWINGGPLTMAELRGRVVLVHFWTFSCVNCLRTLPHMQTWHEAYRAFGLTVLGIHTPEFGLERGEARVRAEVMRLGLTYPVAVDDDYRMWKSYGNRYWPAYYFIDAQGAVRAHHYGEGGYAEAEQIIHDLLEEAGHDLTEAMPTSGLLPDPTPPPSDLTPETHLGWNRLEYLGSPETVRPGGEQRYSCPMRPALGIFYFCGLWRLDDDFAETGEAGAGIVYRIHASRVYLVAESDQPGGIRARVFVDGQPARRHDLGNDAASDEQGAYITVGQGRLYEVVNFGRGPRECTLELRAEAAGLRAYAFTFG
jgi:thiol-disulfide isomerase/thioredoxin